ncbi:sugar transporter [Coccidioides immitis H538.4]|uniref:Sugar transporter n=1 Tax=Coccidioides immitis H538.4 TaxID=396776 RepID=A0A0J8RVN6_COCIT|nr:sugar transporter [Coccidioides immitis H538.4]
MGKLVPNAFNLAVVIFVALGSTACSYGMAIISSTIGQPSFYHDFNLAKQGEPGYGRTSSLIGAMNGLNSAGSAFGCAFLSWSADRYGRLRSLQIGSLILVIGAALCAGSVNMAMFLVARFIAGFGIGILVTGIPMYQAEASAPSSRGFMELFQMEKQLELDREINQNTGKWDILKTGPTRRRALVGFALMFGNQFTGVLIIANYGVLLYASLGMKTFMPLLLSALWVTASFPGNVFTAFFVDRLGRRFFLLTGLGGILFTLIMECWTQAVYLGTDNAAGQKAAVFFLFLFIFFWSTFIDATQFLYLAEIFPTQTRSQGMALGMAGMFAATIILLISGPIALDQITWKFFFVLIIPTALHLAGVYFFYPETKQRSLEDINAAFGEKVAVRLYGATEEEEEMYAKALEAREPGASGDMGTIPSSEDEKSAAHVEAASKV